MRIFFVTQFKIVLLFIGVTIFLSACSAVPITGRSQFLLTTPIQEKQLGEQAWQQIKRKEHETSNKKYAAVVTRVGKNIAAIAGAPEFDWEFKTFDSGQANAFCLPGGKVAVYTGILKYMTNDAELAAVMGHEIGHAIARHGGERISQEQTRSIGQSILAEMTALKYRQLAVAVYGGATNVAIMLPYSRSHEYEADYIGMILMSRAGYNPKYAISFWGKFAKSSNSSTIEEFISTHPISSKRITEMQKLLPKALKIYERAKVKHNAGKLLKK